MYILLSGRGRRTEGGGNADPSRLFSFYSNKAICGACCDNKGSSF